MLIKELVDLNNKDGGSKKYKCVFSANAIAYNNPDYFDIPDDCDSDVSVTTGSSLVLFTEKCLVRLTKADHGTRSAEHAMSSDGIKKLVVTEAYFDISSLLSDVSEKSGDMEDDDGEPMEFNVYEDACQGQGPGEMPYSVKFEVTLAPGVEMAQKDANWIGTVMAEAIWGQYASDIDIVTDFKEVE